MKLRSLILENIRSYSHQKINFPNGSLLLSGDIGSGKSTILLAVEFALFGIRRKHLPGSSLLRHGEKKGSVELNFVVDDREIIIKRSLKKKKKDIEQDSGYIIIDGKKKEATAVELKSQILEILGYPQDLITKTKNLIYRYTVYTPQEEMKQILLDDDEDRLDTLRKVFGIDKYKRIRANTYTSVKFIRDQIKNLEENTADLDDLKRSRQDKKKGLDSSKRSLEELKPKLDNITKKIDDQKKQIKKIESDLTKIRSIKKEIELADYKISQNIERSDTNSKDIKQLDSEIKTLDKRFSEIKIGSIDADEKTLEKEISSKEKTLEKIVQKKIELKNLLENCRKNISDIDEDIKKTSKKVINLPSKQQELDDLKERLSKKDLFLKKLVSYEKEFNDILLKLNSLETKKGYSERIKNKVSNLDRCPTCLQDVSKEHKKEITSKENKTLEDISKEMRSLRSRKEDLSKEITRLKDIDKKISKDENKKAILFSEIKNMQETSKELVDKKKNILALKEKEKTWSSEIDMIEKQDTSLLKKEIIEKKKQLSELIKKIELKKQKDLIEETLAEKSKRKRALLDEQISIKKSIGALNSSKIDLKKQLSGLKDSEESYNKIRYSLDDLQKKDKELGVKAAYLEKDIASFKKDIERLDKEILKREDLIIKIKRLKEFRDWLSSHFIKLMSSIEKQIMLTAYNEFDMFFQQWFNILMEDESLSVKLDTSFNPVVIQNGYEVPLNNLSGGEKTAAALAYRLALNKVVNDIIQTIKTRDLIILDEPTDGFSRDQVERMRDLLEQMNTSQTIIVSHEQDMESFVDNVIDIYKKEHESFVS